MDTNIRFVTHRDRLFLWVRKLNLSKDNLSHSQLQTVCLILKKRGIAAAPYSDAKGLCLVVESREKISNCIQIELDSNENSLRQFVLEIRLSNTVLQLSIANPLHKATIEGIYARRSQIGILRNTNLWVANLSPNVFYEPKPLHNDDEDDDIEAYQRYYVFTEYLEGKGLAFGVDIGTSYFTALSVAEYQASGQQKRFSYLLQRQGTEYKGTLLYRGPNGNSRCYFSRYDGKTTLEQTESFIDGGEQFENSYDYFKKRFPSFKVDSTDTVAFVSFKRLGTLPVPAKYLFLAVSTEDINQQDKYTAQQKTNLIHQFWKRAGDVFGANFQALEKTPFAPNSNDAGLFDMPTIVYADNIQLHPPAVKRERIYKKYFLTKFLTLKESGCYHVPPVLNREMHFVFPESLAFSIRTTLIEGLINDCSLLTKKLMEATEHEYEKDEHLNKIFDLKHNYDPGTVVFVFDNADPAVYYTISQELPKWKIIRLTKQELIRKFYGLKNPPRGKSQWETYLALNAFKVVTELGCVPYIFKERLTYGVQMMIDVSEKYSHFGLGIMIYSEGMNHPLFDYIIKPNSDSHSDLINPYLLKKHLKALLLKHISQLSKYNINNMLVLRDGVENRSEYDVFSEVIQDLKGTVQTGKPLLAQNFDFTFVEYHKNSRKSFRLFENENGEIRNPLEGTWMLINKLSAILLNTGAGTLTQGTSNPILIKSSYREVDMKPILRDIFLTSQLSFGSPRVAQRLTYLAKRIDDLLKEKKSQEVRKIK